MDHIWSIKNNIDVTNKFSRQMPGAQQGWDRGSNGFYSRHSGPTGQYLVNCDTFENSQNMEACGHSF